VLPAQSRQAWSIPINHHCTSEVVAMKIITAVIVGQDAYCARILEFALNRRRLNVVRADRALGLHSLLEAYRPDLVLLDVDTPDLDCAEVVQFLRSCSTRRAARTRRSRGSPAAARTGTSPWPRRSR
jgi:response regulator RpfG family c-di-GMP phosphodiesterase